MKTRINNKTFDVDTSLLPEQWKSIDRGEWEPNTFVILDRVLNKNDVALDIGSWSGPLSLYMAEKGANVHAFEPDPIAFNALVTNIEKNPSLPGSIMPWKKAIAPKTGNLPLHAREHYGYSSSSLLSRSRDCLDSEMVEGISLDSWALSTRVSHADFVKMDIEGGEFLLFDQLKEFLIKVGRPTMLISLHYGHLNESFYKKRVKWRLLAKALMRMENSVGTHFFRSSLLRQLETVMPLINLYPHCYDVDTLDLISHQVNPSYLLRNSCDLLLCTKPLTESE